MVRVVVIGGRPTWTGCVRTPAWAPVDSLTEISAALGCPPGGPHRTSRPPAPHGATMVRVWLPRETGGRGVGDRDVEDPTGPQRRRSALAGARGTNGGSHRHLTPRRGTGRAHDTHTARPGRARPGGQVLREPAHCEAYLLPRPGRMRTSCRPPRNRSGVGHWSRMSSASVLVSRHGAWFDATHERGR